MFKELGTARDALVFGAFSCRRDIRVTGSAVCARRNVLIYIYAYALLFFIHNLFILPSY